MRLLHRFLQNRKPLDVSTIAAGDRAVLLQEIHEYYDFLKRGESEVRRKMAGDSGYLYVYEEELKRCKAAITVLESPRTPTRAEQEEEYRAAVAKAGIGYDDRTLSIRGKDGEGREVQITFRKRGG